MVRSPMRRSQRRPSLLFLQLDSAKLARDGLSLAPLARTVAVTFASADIEVVESTTQQTLLERLAELCEGGRVFDVVVVVAHSNEYGIQIAADAVCPWDAFARYLRPFNPRRLCLVACRAGRSTPARTLFDVLPKLRRIYASPVKASLVVGQVLVALAPLLLSMRAPKLDHVRLAQTALLCFGKAQVWQWLRNERDAPEAMLLDAFADFLDASVRTRPPESNYDGRV